MQCEKCDKEIPKNINYCPTCSLAANSNYTQFLEEQRNKSNKIYSNGFEETKKNLKGIIIIFLPLFLYCMWTYIERPDPLNIIFGLFLTPFLVVSLLMILGLTLLLIVDVINKNNLPKKTKFIKKIVIFIYIIFICIIGIIIFNHFIYS